LHYTSISPILGTSTYASILTQFDLSQSLLPYLFIMDTSKPHVQLALTIASSLMGVLAISGGLYGITNPVAFASTLGIPITSPNSPALPFVSFAAARNLGSGVTMLGLIATGQRKAVGTVLICSVVVAMADAWICAKFGATEGKAAGHAVMGIVTGILGGGMYWFST
jgi:hypothetical protein